MVEVSFLVWRFVSSPLTKTKSQLPRRETYNNNECIDHLKETRQDEFVIDCWGLHNTVHVLCHLVEWEQGNKMFIMNRYKGC